MGKKKKKKISTTCQTLSMSNDKTLAEGHCQMAKLQLNISAFIYTSCKPVQSTGNFIYIYIYI